MRGWLLTFGFLLAASIAHGGEPWPGSTDLPTCSSAGFLVDADGDLVNVNYFSPTEALTVLQAGGSGVMDEVSGSDPTGEWEVCADDGNYCFHYTGVRSSINVYMSCSVTGGLNANGVGDRQQYTLRQAASDSIEGGTAFALAEFTQATALRYDTVTLGNFISIDADDRVGIASAITDDDSSPILVLRAGGCILQEVGNCQ